MQTAATSPKTLEIPDDSHDPENRLACYLASVPPKPPDPALVAERWDALPDALKAGILALVKSIEKPT